MTDTAMQPDRAQGPRDSAEHEVHEHPSTRTYWVIAFVLFILTMLEVGVFYIDALEPALLPILMVLTTAKFVLVVMFYMHLKMDSRIFTWVFAAPLFLAMFLVVAMVILFKILPLYAS
jgi:caa(3)-type oxidase subunit IV